MASNAFPARFSWIPFQSNPFRGSFREQTLSILTCLLLVGVATPDRLSAEPPKPTGHSDPVDEVVGSDYLERHHAARNIAPLKRSVELDIRRLGILVRYMSKEVDSSEKDYSEVAAIYRKAVETYYGGDALEAYRHLMASHARALDLYRKFSEVYRTKTVQMATEITQKIATLETDTQATVSFLDLAEATHRLAIVRNQIKLGDEMLRFRRPDQAINQYKNARLMTILTAYHLEADPAKKREILQKYDGDLKELGFNRSNLVEEIMVDQSVPPAKPSTTKEPK